MDSSSIQVTIEEEIARVEIGAPHLVILGAGASRAACPDGDARGRPLPLMNDLAALPGGARLLPGRAGENFEEIYSALAANPANAPLLQTLEQEIRQYFSELELPPNPTIYDYLVLSLRSKDVIATFNWDPFLIQAIRRNYARRGDRYPHLIFLHGNVLAGYCATHRILGTVGTLCAECGTFYEPSRLLYPVAAKDYDSDPMIVAAWQSLKQNLKRAFMVTVFGYSAPASDAAAIETLRSAWGTPDQRQMEQFEVIDIRPEEQLYASWEPFIHSHHYEIHADYFSSFLAIHPRRTGEAYCSQFVEARFTTPNPPPRAVQFDALSEWFGPLIEAEIAAGQAAG